jgi:CBS domain containing-hemolysin-like protein
MALLVFYVALALCVSFLCSLLESSLLTITPTQVRTAEEQGAKWAARLKRLKDDIERPLAAILTLNTIAHTMGAAGAGAQYAKLYGNGGEAFFAAFLTLAILVVTEIIPKTLGARYARALAPFSAWILPIMITALGPLVWASRKLTGFITMGRAADSPQHRDELLAVASLGQASGQIDSSEARFMKNMLQLHALKASDVMTPRTVVFTLAQDVPLADFAARIREAPYTRVPVYRDNADNITGFVIKHEVLSSLLNGDSEGDGVNPLIRPLPHVLDETTVDRLFRRMISEHHHIMAVVDEYGTFLGLVTLEDVLETIFGFEIVDELDEVPDLQEYARELSRRRVAGAARPSAGDGLNGGA